MVDAWLPISTAAAATAFRSTTSNSTPSPCVGVASFPSRFFIRVTTCDTVRIASRWNSGSSKFLSALRLKSDSDDTLFLMSWMMNDVRSEEHTSELQSHHDLVCRLLLE